MANVIMAINPKDHPYQPGVKLDRLEVVNIRIFNGGAIDGVARMEVDMRPYARVQTNPGVTPPTLPIYAYVPDPNPESISTCLVIDDIYKLVADRAGAGDFEPFQLVELLTKVIGAEYHRRNGG